MGRRHRDQQAPRRGETGPSRPTARPTAARRRRNSQPRYFTDLLGILGIAIILNLALAEVGFTNSLLRILVALIVGRLVVSGIRLYLESRLRKKSSSG